MTKLDARVAAVNMANAATNDLQKKMIEAFRLFVGQKVVKADNTLTAKCQAVADAFTKTGTRQLLVYSHHTKYSLLWVAKSCIVLDGRAYCHEVSLYVGELSEQVLARVCEPCERRTDYTAAEIEAARERYATAKKAADDAEAELYPFGEYDQ